MRIILTGGAGFIGTHVLAELIKYPHQILVLDNLQNSYPNALEYIQNSVIKKVQFRQGDICNEQFLEDAFASFHPDVVLHLAGQKSVTESVSNPLYYYEKNIGGSVALLKVMSKTNVKNFVFSSSASVYGSPVKVPTDENNVCNPIHSYGRTKLMVEDIVKDWVNSTPDASATILRYFNPIGAHHSGVFGDNPKNIIKNVVSALADCAMGKVEKVLIFGNDYKTPDGTCIRDFLHIEDLAKGHSNAVELLSNKPGFVVINLGTGNGTSVLNLLETFERSSGKKIPFEIRPRRKGDIPISVADPTKAIRILNWQAEKSLDQMCFDAWQWFSRDV